MKVFYVYERDFELGVEVETLDSTREKLKEIAKQIYKKAKRPYNRIRIFVETADEMEFYYFTKQELE